MGPVVCRWHVTIERAPQDHSPTIQAVDGSWHSRRPSEHSGSNGSARARTSIGASTSQPAPSPCWYHPRFGLGSYRDSYPPRPGLPIHHVARRIRTTHLCHRDIGRRPILRVRVSFATRRRGSGRVTHVRSVQRRPSNISDPRALFAVREGLQRSISLTRRTEALMRSVLQAPRSAVAEAVQSTS